MDGRDSLAIAAAEIQKELEQLAKRQRKLESALKPLLALIEEGGPSHVQIDFDPPEFRPDANALLRKVAKKGTTIVDAAEVVLRVASEPLRTAEIARRLLAAGFKYDKDFKTLRSSVMGSLDHRVRARETFVKTGPGSTG